MHIQGCGPCTPRIGDLAHSGLGALHTQDCRTERPRGTERPTGGRETLHTQDWGPCTFKVGGFAHAGLQGREAEKGPKGAERGREGLRGAERGREAAMSGDERR